MDTGNKTNCLHGELRTLLLGTFLNQDIRALGTFTLSMILMTLKTTFGSIGHKNIFHCYFITSHQFSCRVGWSGLKLGQSDITLTSRDGQSELNFSAINGEAQSGDYF